MTKNINLQKNYTTLQHYKQVVLPIDVDYIIPVNDSVRLLSQFVEEMDLTKLYSTYSRIRENQVTPRQMLKIMIYGYMNKKFSARDIESSCRRDVNFMYILEGKASPDHSTIARFRSIHFAQCAESILAQMSNFLFDINEISGEQIFIDGTKIESCANKYTFVWKRAITKNLEKLLNKLADFVGECEELYGFKIIFKNQVQLRHIKKLRKKLYSLKKQNDVKFVHGIGKRKTPLQRSIEKLEEYLSKLKEYTHKIYNCGERNSYSKTDTDSTFMRMKEDAMKNGQLKPAYNLQHGVDSEYIVWVSINQNPTDTPTLIPFLKGMEKFLKFKYLKIVADAGYESEENYVFIKENGQLSFIKPTNYEVAKTRKFKKDIGKIENMTYNINEDYYICENNRQLHPSKIANRKSRTGYISERTTYTCVDCSNCEYKTNCIKGNNSKTPMTERIKTLETSKVFNKLRKESYERIITIEGSKLRMNRSIQAEGSFAEIKQDMGFRRFLSKGKKNVLAESILLAMARNINKLHHKIQSNKTNTHLFEFKNIA